MHLTEKGLKWCGYKTPLEDSNAPEHNRELLLEEYKLCQASVERLESTIWQTSGVIGIGTIAAFISQVSKNIDSVSSTSVFLSGILVIASIWIWWGMARRWWDIQHTVLLRMRHIEEDLGMYQYSYLAYRDGEADIYDPKDTHALRLQRRLQDRIELLEEDPKFKAWGIQKWLRFFPPLVTMVWLLYALIIIMEAWFNEN